MITAAPDRLRHRQPASPECFSSASMPCGLDVVGGVVSRWSYRLVALWAFAIGIDFTLRRTKKQWGRAIYPVVTEDKATPLLKIVDWRGGSSGFHVPVGSFGFPVVADLGEDGGGKPQERGLVREERGDASPSLDLLVEALEPVARLVPTPTVMKKAHRQLGTTKGSVVRSRRHALRLAEPRLDCKKHGVGTAFTSIDHM